MFKNTPAFSGFSVDNLEKARKFYGDTLGVNVDKDDMGLYLNLKGAGKIFVYEKENHIPATFTLLNFIVPDINKAVDELSKKGIRFEHYTGDMATDEKGILRGIAANMGPDIAWFKDPAGNFLSVLQEK